MVERIECSVWNNGGRGWGLRVLGGVDVCKRHFRPAQSPIYVELGGHLFPFNVAKKSFWTGCGELIGVALRDWIAKNGLSTGDRVMLEVIKPYRTFRVVRMRTPVMKDIA